MHEVDPTQRQDAEQDEHADVGMDPRDAEIETLRARLEQLGADVLRDRADLENQRKRLEREARHAALFANKQLFGGLLPVFDSLEAALGNAESDDPMRDGVVLTLRELSRVAENHGLFEVAPKVGDAFDPDKHQAMSVLDVPHVAPGAVAQMFQKGYLLHEQLLRPALVAVTPHD